MSVKDQQTEDHVETSPKAGEAVARWQGHGTLRVADDGVHLIFRSDSYVAKNGAPSELAEAWPEQGHSARDKVCRFWRGLGATAGEWTALGHASITLRERVLASVAADERRAREERERSERVYRAERAMRDDMERVFGGGPAWRRGTFSIAVPEGPKHVDGTVSPSGLFGIFRSEIDKAPDSWTLTHVPSGMRVASGRKAHLVILAARLEAIPGMDWRKAKPSMKDLAPGADLALAFRRTGDPFVLTEAQHARIAREVTP